MLTSGLFNGIYKMSENFSRFVILNMLWILVNILVLLSAFNLLIARPDDRLFFIMTTLIFLPFFLFPSTIALFAVVRKWMIDEDHSKMVGSFFRNIKNYYVKGMIIGFLFSMICLILMIDFYYLHEFGLWIELFLAVVCVFIFVYTIHFFCVIVHYDTNWKDMLNKTLLLTIGNPISFIANLLIHAGLLTIIYFFPLFLIAGYGVLGAYLSFSLFYKYYLKAVDVAI